MVGKLRSWSCPHCPKVYYNKHQAEAHQAKAHREFTESAREVPPSPETPRDGTRGR